MLHEKRGWRWLRKLEGAGVIVRIRTGATVSRLANEYAWGIPCFKAGRKLLFDPMAGERALLQRPSQSDAPGGGT
jgi:hypothetical protein